MEHEDAIRTHAAERYLLGEMSVDERSLYEEHYFSCPACEQELTTTAAFIDNAQASFLAAGAAADRRAPPAGQTAADVPWWRRLFAAPPAGLVPTLSGAALLLLAVAGYQQFGVIANLQQQLERRDQLHPVPTIALRSATRGGDARLVVAPTDLYAVLQADVLPETTVERYTATLRADGQERYSTTIAAPPPGIPASILVPLRDLQAGQYALVFTDASRPEREIGRFTFTLDKP